MPIVWTKNFPASERPLGYLRLLLARYRYHNRLVPTLRGGLPAVREVPGYKAVLKSWRNKHRGRRAFVIGNGPSLNRMDLSPLRDEITIGCNAIYKNFAQWGWHTDYLLFEDIEQTELRRKDIPGVKGPMKLLGLHNAYAIKADADTFFMNVRNLDAAFMDEQFPQFSKDFGHIVHLASTVTHIGLQLAWHLGCDPVYLIGVDHNYGELPRLYPPCKITITEDNYDLVRGIHVQDDYYKIGDVIGVPPVDYMEAGYRKAREAFEEDGRRVINAGLDSKLEVFEKAEFAALFTKPEPSPKDADGKPKVLFITHDVGRLGAQMSLLGLIRRLRATHGFDCRVLVREPNGTLMGEFKKLGETDVFWPADAPRTIGGHQKAILDKTRAWAPDLIYSNTAVNGDVTEYLGSIAPVVVHVHELEWYLKTLDEPRHRALVSQPALYIACSDAVRRNLVANHSIPVGKIEVMYESIDFDDVRGKTNAVPREEIRRKLGIPADAVVVGNCGRIDERKGWDLFVDIAERVIKANDNVYFLWVGHGPNHADLIKAAEARGIADRVKAPGPQENPFPYFNSMDIALVTSRDDPFPLVVMEAAFHGCPVCAFASSGGACEFIGSDRGLTVPEVDAAAMAAQIDRLVRDAELRKKLGENARRAAMGYDTEPIARRLMQILGDRFGFGSLSPSRPQSDASRILSFPSRAVGKLQIRDAGSRVWSWRDLAPAAGHVEVPPGQEVLFLLDRDAASDVSFFSALEPDAIQSMFLGRTQLNDRQIENVARMSGLLTLDLRETPITDTSAGHLARLTALKSLVLPSQITEAAVARLKTALPNCNVTRADGPPTLAQAQPGGRRTVTFPEKSVGLLMTRPWGLTVWNWNELGSAKGEVAVPPRSELMLVVSRGCANDLGFLDQLNPDDIQSIHMRQAAIGDDQLKRLARLTGLRTLDLRDSKITDAGTQQLKSLLNLKLLNLPDQITANVRADLKKSLRDCRIN
ncbi:MAG: glycosyltransferase [Candidatus Sumerlaeia bacterium]